MKLPRCLQVIWLSCLLMIGGTRANGYDLEGWHWPSDQPIVLDLELGKPDETLIDGSTSWNQVAEAALGIWNPYLESGVQFTDIEDNTSPSQGDGKNSVFFSSTIYGEDFGEDALAVSLTLYSNGAGFDAEAADGTSTGVAYEADVIFNSAQTFNSYRGPLREDSAGDALYDLRRVAIHEFGNVLGLADASQDADAIMTSVISDIDTVQPDDIAGVESIYGAPPPAVPVVTSVLSVNGLVGQGFTYQILAAPAPDSYQASGLPDGLSVDTATGVISGTPTVPGAYQVTISATNISGTGSASLTLVFALAPVITSAPSAPACVGYAFRYQITALGAPNQFNASGLPAGLTIDTRTGIISGKPTTGGYFPVSLQATNAAATTSANLGLNISFDPTLTVLHTFARDALDGSFPTALILGGDGNLYGTTLQGGASGHGIFFRCSPGGVLTPLYDFGAAGTFSPLALRQATDGSFYGATGDGVEQLGIVFKLTVDGTLTTLYTFPTSITSGAVGINILQASDGNYYGTTYFDDEVPLDGYNGTVFKLTPDGTMTTLYQFTAGSDGFRPSALTQATDGNFYGTTVLGGTGQEGTIFKITPDGVLTTLHTFTHKDGAFPATTLLQGRDGNFYGTALEGGNESQDGTIFKITPDGTFTVLHRFKRAAGTGPSGALVQDADGNLYGTAGLGGGLTPNGVLSGTIFKLTPGGVLTTLHTFIQAEGIPPFFDLMSDNNGDFFGGCGSLGGGGGTGTIFKETPGATFPVVSSTLPVVTVTATTPKATLGGAAGGYTVTLSTAQTTPVLIHYTVGGSAVNGTDYSPLSGTLKIKPGKTSKTIQIVPLGNLEGAASKKIKLTLLPDDSYTVGTTTPVKVKILHGE